MDGEIVLLRPNKHGDDCVIREASHRLACQGEGARMLGGLTGGLRQRRRSFHILHSSPLLIASPSCFQIDHIQVDGNDDMDR